VKAKLGWQVNTWRVARCGAYRRSSTVAEVDALMAE
jgi:L-arabinose isomerase